MRGIRLVAQNGPIPKIPRAPRRPPLNIRREPNGKPDGHVRVRSPRAHAQRAGDGPGNHLVAAHRRRGSPRFPVYVGSRRVGAISRANARRTHRQMRGARQHGFVGDVAGTAGIRRCTGIVECGAIEVRAAGRIIVVHNAVVQRAAIRPTAIGSRVARSACSCSACRHTPRRRSEAELPDSVQLFSVPSTPHRRRRSSRVARQHAVVQRAAIRPTAVVGSRVAGQRAVVQRAVRRPAAVEPSRVARQHAVVQRAAIRPTAAGSRVARQHAVVQRAAIRPTAVWEAELPDSTQLLNVPGSLAPRPATAPFTIDNRRWIASPHGSA